MAALHELMNATLDGQTGVINARLEAMERATDLIRRMADRVPTEVDIKVSNLEKVHDEKFRSIAIQFLERDVRTEQTSRDSKVAVDAALQAAKEAVGAQTIASDRAIAKSEAATAEQIKQLVTLGQAQNESVREVMGDLKDRLTRLEERGIGQVVATTAAQTTHTTFNSQFIAAVAVVVAFAGLLVVIFRG